MFVNERQTNRQKGERVRIFYRPKNKKVLVDGSSEEEIFLQSNMAEETGKFCHG